MLKQAEDSSATAPPGSRDYKATAISHWNEMIAQ